jgi:hypothetical protein
MLNADNQIKGVYNSKYDNMGVIVCNLKYILKSVINGLFMFIELTWPSEIFREEKLKIKAKSGVNTQFYQI